MFERFVKVFSSKEGAVVIWLVIIVLIIGFVALLFALIGLPYPMP